MISHAVTGSLGVIGASLIRSSAVLLAAILLAWLLRSRSASLRHFMLSLFLISLMFFPLFSSFPGGWEVRWLPSWFASGENHQPGDEPGLLIGSILPAESQEDLASGSGIRPPEGLIQANPPRTDKRSGFGATLGMVLLAVWAAGLTVLLLRLALGVLGARRLTREGERLEDSTWQKLLQRFVRAVSLRRKVTLRGHQKVPVPLTWGLLKPVVLMPAGAGAWSEEQRSSALFHELSHVKRGDFLTLLLVRLSLALYWINPLTWVVFRILKSEQEKACDELVIRAGIRPSTYAANLISFKRAAGLAGSPAAAFLGVLGMFGRSRLNDRLAAILGQKFAFQEVKMKTKIMISAVAFLAVGFIGLARPTTASHPSEVEALVQEPVMIGAAESWSLETASQESQPTQESQPAEESQEKKQTESAVEPKEPKKKAQPDVGIAVEVQEAKEGPVEITIIEGDSKKSIRVEKPVIKVIKNDAGKKIVVLSGEKEVLVIGGDDVELKIKGDKAVHLKSGVPLKLEKGVEIRSGTKYEPGEKTIIIEGKPYIEIVKEVGIPECTTIYLEGKEGEVKTLVIAPKVAVEPHVHMEPPVAPEPPVKGAPPTAPKPPAAVAPPAAEAPRVAVEPRAVVEPHIVIEEPVHVHEFMIDPAEREELQKKIAETQALLMKIEAKEFEEAKIEAQKEALRELKEALKDLQQELEKEKETVKAVRVKVEKPEKSFTVIRAKPYVTGEAKVGVLEGGKDNVITVINKDGVCTFVLTGKLAEGQSQAYEKAMEKLRTGLPQGYELESELQEESSRFVIKVKGASAAKDTFEAIEDLLKGFREDLKK